MDAYSDKEAFQKPLKFNSHEKIIDIRIKVNQKPGAGVFILVGPLFEGMFFRKKWMKMNILSIFNFS